MIDILKALSALCGLIVALLSLRPIGRRYLFRRRRRLTLEGMEKLQRIHGSLEKIRSYGADRAIVFAGHNSGGYPRAGSPYYTSALYWSAEKASSEVIPNYKNIPVDARYIEMLLDAERSGKYHFKVEKEPNSQLLKYYRFEKVTDSWIYYLGIVENNFLYMSISTKGGKLSQTDLVPIELEVENIRNNI